jgi:hypothetical protein
MADCAGNEMNFDKVANAQATARAQELLQENMPAYKAEFAIKARICFMKYEVLRKEGFSRSEALELCWRDISI